jgi:hypothetical protein
MSMHFVVSIDVSAAGTYTAASTTSLAERAGGFGAAAGVPALTALVPDEFTTIRSMRGFVPSAAVTVTSAAATANSVPLEITAPFATAGVMSAPPVTAQPETTQSTPLIPATRTSRYS